jgi:hypothetical protein
MSTDNLAEFMGVEVVEVETPVEAELAPVYGEVAPSGTISRGQRGYVLDGRLNDSFESVNRLFRAGAVVRRASRDGDGFRRGDFLVGPTVDQAVLSEIVDETGVAFEPLDTEATAASYANTPQRIGMYKRYYGGNIDEGWTRWLLEDFAFDYVSVMDADLVAGNLNGRFDVIILPADSEEMMTGEREGGAEAVSSVPPEYRSGFGAAGVRALEAFVENGGTLVTFAQAGDLVLEEFDVPVRDVVAGLSGQEFWSPGSTLNVRIDGESAFAYGMPDDALATFLSGGQVYETLQGARSASVERIVTYPDRDILQSGWLLGEEAIANRAAAVAVGMGRGTILMIGFRPQHRAQTHGTFKLLFNALIDRPDPSPPIAAGGDGGQG